MASSVRSTSRNRATEPAMPQVAELHRLRLVLTPQARDIFPDKEAVLERVPGLLPDKDTRLPQELVLWHGAGVDRVVALVNPYVRTVYVERFGREGHDPRREDAIRGVDLSVGARPDLMPGSEYVRRVRGIWKGLLPRERP
jgi:hypothetical protein